MKRNVHKQNLQWNLHLFTFAFKRNTIQILVLNSGMSCIVEKIHAEKLQLLINCKEIESRTIVANDWKDYNYGITQRKGDQWVLKLTQVQEVSSFCCLATNNTFYNFN